MFKCVLGSVPWRAAIFLVVLVTASGGALIAQDASLAGTVTDPQGAVVPGAEVALINPSTGTRRMVVSDDQGRYLIAQVAPGTY